MTTAPHTDPRVEKIPVPSQKPQTPKPEKAVAQLRIVSDRGEAEPFPIAALPSTMRMAVEVIAEQVQAPVGMVAFSALGALSLAGQAVADVRHPIGGASLPTSVFIAVVAASGERKSTVDRATHAAISARESEGKAVHKDELSRFKLKQEVWESQRRKAISSGEIDDLPPEPSKPLSPKMRISGGTVEGIMREIETRHSFAVSTAEAGGFISGHGMTGDARMRMATALTGLWDNGSAERIVKAESQFLAGRRCSVNLLFQDTFVNDFINDPSIGSQGFLPRFLLSWPQSLRGTRLIHAEKVAELERRYTHETSDFMAALDALLNAGETPDENFAVFPPALTLSGETRRAWYDFHNEIELQQAEGGPYDGRLAPFASRMGENALRLAALLTIYENPASKEVTLPALRGAIAIVQHAMNEAARIIGIAPQTALEAEAEMLLAWMRKKGKPVRARDIQHSGPSKIRGHSAHHIKEGLLRHLIEAGAIFEAQAGRTVTYEVAT